jgi:hypothetical protein
MDSHWIKSAEIKLWKTNFEFWKASEITRTVKFCLTANLMSTTVRHRPGAKKGHWVVILGVVVVKMYSLISQCGILVHCTVVFKIIEIFEVTKIPFRPRFEYDQHYQQPWSQSIGPFDQNRPYIEILVETSTKIEFLWNQYVRHSVRWCGGHN